MESQTLICFVQSLSQSFNQIHSVTDKKSTLLQIALKHSFSGDKSLYVHKVFSSIDHCPSFIIKIKSSRKLSLLSPLNLV